MGYIVEPFEDGDLYDVYYRGADDEIHCVCYFAHSTKQAKRLFEQEQCVGDEIIKIVRCKE